MQHTNSGVMGSFMFESEKIIPKYELSSIYIAIRTLIDKCSY